MRMCGLEVNVSFENFKQFKLKNANDSDDEELKLTSGFFEGLPP